MGKPTVKCRAGDPRGLPAFHFSQGELDDENHSHRRIPPEQVVGTAGTTRYGYDAAGKPSLTQEPKLLLNDNDALAMLVLHDDAEREYAYGPANGLPDTKVGTFTPKLYGEAQKSGWIVIRMKKDWKRIFSFDGE